MVLWDEDVAKQRISCLICIKNVQLFMLMDMKDLHFASNLGGSQQSFAFCYASLESFTGLWMIHHSPL